MALLPCQRLRRSPIRSIFKKDIAGVKSSRREMYVLRVRTVLQVMVPI